MDNFMDRLTEKANSKTVQTQNSEDQQPNAEPVQQTIPQPQYAGQMPQYGRIPQTGPAPVPQYSQPMQQPQYSQPAYVQQPPYGQPSARQGYGMPYGQPVFDSRQRDMRAVHEQPAYGQPTAYEQQMSSHMMRDQASFEQRSDDMHLDPYPVQSQDVLSEKIDDLKITVTDGFGRQSQLINEFGGRLSEPSADQGKADIDVSAIEDIAAKTSADLKTAVEDTVHKEDVKCYRNIQAVIEADTKTQTDHLQTAEKNLKGSIGSVKGLLIFILILLIMNLGASGLLIAHIILGVI